MDEEEVVRDSVSRQEDLVEGVLAGGIVREGDAVLLVIEGPVHHEAVRDVLPEEIFERQIDPEHVFTETSAVTGVPHTMGGDGEFVPSREETVSGRGGIIEIPVAQVLAGDGHKKVYDVVRFAMQADFLNHFETYYNRPA